MNGRYSFSLLLLLLQLRKRKRKRKRRESPDGGREALVATEEAHVSVLCIIIHSLLERRYALLYIIFSSSSPCSSSSSLPLGDSLPWPGVRSNQHSSAQLSSAQLSSAQLSSAQSGPEPSHSVLYCFRRGGGGASASMAVVNVGAISSFATRMNLLRWSGHLLAGCTIV
jgi:hypothetical protein